MIRAVTFDLDGTLYDLAPVKGALLWRAFPYWTTMRVGIVVREELRGREFGSGLGLLDEEAAIVAERTGTSPDSARARLDKVFGKALIGAIAKVGARAGARALLDALVKENIAINVVSDRGAVREKLAALKLDDLPWRSLISADDIGALKPSALLLERVARTALVEPSELLHVGDRDDADGALARAFGCTYAHLNANDSFDNVRRACGLRVQR